MQAIEIITIVVVSLAVLSIVVFSLRKKKNGGHSSCGDCSKCDKDCGSSLQEYIKTTYKK